MIEISIFCFLLRVKTPACDIQAVSFVLDGVQYWSMVIYVYDEKDVKIRELTAELQRERKRSAAYQEQLDMVLRDMEEHSNHLSRNIDDIVQSVKEIESRRVRFELRNSENSLDSLFTILAKRSPEEESDTISPRQNKSLTVSSL
ncbi:hypothetical protein D5086_027019 [Populus alba]|uniref:Uncharacterized protein n=1 Tax=Populus alba TaxID=43335 RepID=A0ACC4B442_POPAL